MWRTLILTVLMGNFLFIGGCANLFQAKSVYSDDAIARIRDQYWEKTPEEMIEGKTKNRESRNEIMMDLLTVSDYYYNEFKTNFHVGRAEIQSAFDLTAIGLDTAAIFSSSGIAPILSATSTAVQGTQGKLSNRLFFNNTTLAIINQMDAMRAQKRLLLESNMANKDYPSYPIQQGVRDVLDYHYTGSVVNALVQIVADSGAEKSKAESLLNKKLVEITEATPAQIDLRQKITSQIGAMANETAQTILGDSTKFNITGVTQAQANRRLLRAVNAKIEAATTSEREATLKEMMNWIQ